MKCAAMLLCEGSARLCRRPVDGGAQSGVLPFGVRGHRDVADDGGVWEAADAAAVPAAAEGGRPAL